MVLAASLAVTLTSAIGCGDNVTPYNPPPRTCDSPAYTHPLDGLSTEEITRVGELLRENFLASSETLYPLIELIEPAKEDVLAWTPGTPLDRKVLVHFSSLEGFQSATVNITQCSVSDVGATAGEPMILFAEFFGALQVALGHPEMVAGVAERDLTPDDAFCLPLTAGNFFDDKFPGARLMKVPCFVNPTGSNFFAKPIEGLFAIVDIGQGQVLEVIDEGAVPIAQDAWGYTQEEAGERAALRPESTTLDIEQTGEPNFTIDGSAIEWDIWRFRYRVDKRPGIVLSNIEVNDRDNWRSVMYQAYLSEVFVPYMDPSPAWYWRTYMDSGEYGFGLFLTPLRAGVDCPEYAKFLPAVVHDDAGQPLTIPDAICVFERSTGDPAWRHFEVLAQGGETPVPAEGRQETELVFRSASEVGNYDYLIDYRFKQNGEIIIKIGATGIDIVKGVASVSMNDATAAADSAFGTLIAPNLVAPLHDHYFNFRLDFDIDQPVNHFATMDIVAGDVDADNPRRSLWKVEHNVAKSEMEARYQTSALTPRYYHVMNMQDKTELGHHPGYMIHHGSVAFGPFDFENDPPMKRNEYIAYSVWNTVYDPRERFAGGEFALQSDGSDTLAQWVKQDRSLMGADVVTWFTAGFHHVPRTEDWPVMSTEWKTIHIMPHNFFSYNPALTLKEPPAE